MIISMHSFFLFFSYAPLEVGVIAAVAVDKRVVVFGNAKDTVEESYLESIRVKVRLNKLLPLSLVLPKLIARLRVVLQVVRFSASSS